MIPTISVIVPVYNVEKYIETCVNSLLRQTYSALEIILVDDGSTDNSGRICDHFSMIDQRIRVIHKKNGGLSDARNKGLDIAKGEFISFIDSDDWVSENYYEILYCLMTEHHCDISVAGIREFDDEGRIHNEVGLKRTTVLERNPALAELLYSKNIENSACNKLFRRKILAECRFPYGKYYEDEYTVYKWFLNAEKVVISGEPSYYWYRKREGSITQKPFSEKEMDRIYASEEKVKFFSTYDRKLELLARRYLTYDCISVIAKRANMKNSEYEKYAVKHIRENILIYFKGDNSKVSKLFAGTCCINLSLAKAIYRLLKKE